MQINYLVANLHLSLHGSKAVDHNFKGMLLNENIQISKYTYIYIYIGWDLFTSNRRGSLILNHCVLVMPYGDIDQPWLR